MVTLRVNTMTCGGCAESVTTAIKSALGQDVKVTINVDTKELVVTGGPKVTVEAVQKAVADAGHEATTCGGEGSGSGRCSAGAACTCGPVCNCGDNCNCSNCPGSSCCTEKGSGKCAAGDKCTCVDCQCGANCQCQDCPGSDKGMDIRFVIAGTAAAALLLGYIIGSNTSSKSTE